MQSRQNQTRPELALKVWGLGSLSGRESCPQSGGTSCIKNWITLEIGSATSGGIRPRLRSIPNLDPIERGRTATCRTHDGSADTTLSSTWLLASHFC